MANDPVLQRSMFQKQTSIAPSVGLGIDSVTTPDQNAKALKSMFQPTVSLNMPTQMLQQEQQPVQSFQEGGIATPLIAQYDFRNQRYQNPPSYAERTGDTNPPESETVLPYAPVTGSAAAKSAERRSQASAVEAQRREAVAAQDVVLSNPEAQQAIRMMDEGRILKNRDLYMKGQDALRRLTEESYVERGLPAMPPVSATPTQRPRSGIAGLDLSGTMGGGEVYSAEPGRSIMSQIRKEEPPPPPAAAPAREKGALELTLDGIREERARSAEDKKQNALLALMQAGFAMAAGRSPNAISNIGAGGQAGIAAFASLEKARREEQAALRRDELSIRLAQAKLAEDPDTVKLFKALGGGDLAKGFDIYNADKKLQAAIETRKDFRASEDDLRAANEYIRSRLSSGMSGSNTGLPTVRLAPKQ